MTGTVGPIGICAQELSVINTKAPKAYDFIIASSPRTDSGLAFIGPEKSNGAGPSMLGEPIGRHCRQPSRRHSLRSRSKACLSQAGLWAWLPPPTVNPLMAVAHPTTARTPTAAPLILVPPSILVRRYTDGIFRPPR